MRKLKQEELGAMEEICLLDCSSWPAQLASLHNPRLPAHNGLGLSKTINNQENAPQIRL